MHRNDLNIALIFCLLLTSCSVGSRYYHPVKTHEPRKSTLGFSISPPPGDSWYEKHKGDSLIYLKKTGPSSYAINTKATEIHFDDTPIVTERLMQYAKRKNRELLATERYRNSRFSVSRQSRTPHCVRYQHYYEDHGVKELKRENYVQVHATGLLCAHPDFPENGIDVYYQERSLPSTNQATYEHEGELFLASLRIHPLSRRP